MQDNIRIAGIVIENNRLLLVKGADTYKEYWTPGGKNEVGESHMQTLKRELQEEVSLDLLSAEFFGEYTQQMPYTLESKTSRSFVYIAKTQGEICVGKEITGFVRMSKKEFEAGTYPLLPATKDSIIPDLIQAGIFI